MIAEKYNVNYVLIDNKQKMNYILSCSYFDEQENL